MGQDEKAMERRCHNCGALPGNPCRTHRGFITLKVHWVRNHSDEDMTACRSRGGRRGA